MAVALNGTASTRPIPQHQRQRLRKWHVQQPRLSHLQRRGLGVLAEARGPDAADTLAHPAPGSSSTRDPLARAQDLPLLGKRIIVTAPRQYAEKLCSKLLSAGARPLWVPGVAITALDPALHATHLGALDRHLLALTRGNDEGLTHVAFTSKNGIHAVLQRLAALTVGPHAPLAAGLSAACDVLRSSGVRLCALGADGQVLLQAGLPVHVSPPEASTQGLVRELEARGEARGARLLCPVPLVTGGLTEPSVVPRFLAALQAAGAHPLRAECYVTALGSKPTECQVETRLLADGHVHAVAFSSTAEAQGLVELMGGQQSVQQAVVRHQVLLAAHGPYTAQGASQVLGLPVTCVSQSFSTFDGLVHALEKAFAGPAGGQHCASSSEHAATTGLATVAGGLDSPPRAGGTRLAEPALVP